MIYRRRSIFGWLWPQTRRHHATTGTHFGLTPHSSRGRQLTVRECAKTISRIQWLAWILTMREANVRSRHAVVFLEDGIRTIRFEGMEISLIAEWRLHAERGFVPTRNSQWNDERISRTFTLFRTWVARWRFEAQCAMIIYITFIVVELSSAPHR